MDTAAPSPGGFFNDLSQLPPEQSRMSQSIPEHNSGYDESQDGNQHAGDSEAIPRPKRIACVVCRKRKLRCDGGKPSCGTCSRLGHECAYNEVRKKSGPKRGYVKQLEARLAQVETLLKTQDPAEQQPAEPQPPMLQPDMATFSSGPFQGLPDLSILPDDPVEPLQKPPVDDPLGISSDFSWEMISLGLEEPLPSQDVIDDLHTIFFQKIHPSMSAIHRPRYLAAMNQSPSVRPPPCLRYIIWCHAASVTSKYHFLTDHFYHRAKKYIKIDEMKGHGESMITLYHAQCWSLIAAFEFKMMYFPRAWMSSGNASRMCMMMGLHRQDGLGLDVKQCLPPARDWTEREERRRTFWSAFCQDRYASIGTGWPMMIDERDILTNLPSSDEAYVNGIGEKTPTLAEVLTGDGTSSLSPMGCVVLMACLFGRNLHHLHRPDAQDNGHDLNGEFWKRHRALDNIILNTSLSLPSHLRLSNSVSNSNIVFGNMCLHTSTICLHQAAIFKAEKNRMPNQIGAESKRRCIIAADQITNIMKMISHVDPSTMNPFLVFCLYVASRVFVQYLKSRPDDQTVKSSLQFLLSAMNALKDNNPLTESFLIQLDVDLEGSGLGELSSNKKFSTVAMKAAERCTVIEMHDLDSSHQSQNAPGPGAVPTGRFSTPLPNRQKPPTPEGHGPRMMSGVLPPDLNPFDGSIRQTTEMDFSPDVSSSSDRFNTASDHPTPSTTHNSSTNSSFTPPNMDHPSPQKQAYNAQSQSSNFSSRHPSLQPNSSIHVTPTTASYMANTSSYVQLFPAEGGDGGISNPFAMPDSWGHATRQESVMRNAESGFGDPSGLGQMDDGQWEQMLNNMGWNNWGNT